MSSFSTAAGSGTPATTAPTSTRWSAISVGERVSSGRTARSARALPSLRCPPVTRDLITLVGRAVLATETRHDAVETRTSLPTQRSISSPIDSNDFVARERAVARGGSALGGLGARVPFWSHAFGCGVFSHAYLTSDVVRVKHSPKGGLPVGVSVPSPRYESSCPGRVGVGLVADAIAHDCYRSVSGGAGSTSGESSFAQSGRPQTPASAPACETPESSDSMVQSTPWPVDDS